MEVVIMVCRHGGQQLSEIRSWDMPTFYRIQLYLARRITKEFPPSPQTGGVGPRGRAGA